MSEWTKPPYFFFCLSISKIHRLSYTTYIEINHIYFLTYPTLFCLKHNLPIFTSSEQNQQILHFSKKKWTLTKGVHSYKFGFEGCHIHIIQMPQLLAAQAKHVGSIAVLALHL